MKFIKLTNQQGGGAIYVNSVNILTLQPKGTGKDCCTEIDVGNVNARTVMVTEKPEAIVAMIGSQDSPRE